MTQDDSRENAILNHLGLSQRVGKRNGPDCYLHVREVDFPTSQIPNNGLYFSVPGKKLIRYLGKHGQQAILGTCPIELKGSTRIKFNVKKNRWGGQLSTDARLSMQKLRYWANQYIILSAHDHEQKPIAIRVARIADLPFLHRFHKTITENSEDFKPVWSQLTDRAKKLIKRGLTLNDPAIKWEECEQHSIELPLDNAAVAKNLFLEYVSLNPIHNKKQLMDHALELKWKSSLFHKAHDICC